MPDNRVIEVAVEAESLILEGCRDTQESLR
jgi:hypothetical protein